jgi:predicted nuclease of predicted toxin-antitoxin system
VRFLVDASLPRSAAGVLRTLGHEATDVRDIGLGGASDETIADHARRDKLTLGNGPPLFSETTLRKGREPRYPRRGRRRARGGGSRFEPQIVSASS